MARIHAKLEAIEEDDDVARIYSAAAFDQVPTPQVGFHTHWKARKQDASFVPTPKLLVLFPSSFRPKTLKLIYSRHVCGRDLGPRRAQLFEAALAAGYHCGGQIFFPDHAHGKDSERVH